MKKMVREKIKIKWKKENVRPWMWYIAWWSLKIYQPPIMLPSWTPTLFFALKCFNIYLWHTTKSQSFPLNTNPTPLSYYTTPTLISIPFYNNRLLAVFEPICFYIFYILTKPPILIMTVTLQWLNPTLMPYSLHTPVINHYIAIKQCGGGPLIVWYDNDQSDMPN